jgi:hypothetical protein
MLITFRRIGSRKIRRQTRSRPQIERLEGRGLPAPPDLECRPEPAHGCGRRVRFTASG